jgi:hypothetical protein
MIPDLIKYILQFAVYDMCAFEDALSHGLANSIWKKLYIYIALYSYATVLFTVLIFSIDQAV